MAPHDWLCLTHGRWHAEDCVECLREELAALRLYAVATAPVTEPAMLSAFLKELQADGLAIVRLADLKDMGVPFKIITQTGEYRERAE